MEGGTGSGDAVKPRHPEEFKPKGGGNRPRDQRIQPSADLPTPTGTALQKEVLAPGR
jgi:hypothetical protein